MSNVYTFDVNLSGLVAGAGKKLKIELAEGLCFEDWSEDDDVFKAQIEGGNINMGTPPEIEYTSRSPVREPVVQKKTTGIRTAEVELKGSVIALTWRFKLRPESSFQYKNIADAIKVTYSEENPNPASVSLAIGAQITTVPMRDEIPPLIKCVENQSSVYLEESDSASLFPMFEDSGFSTFHYIKLVYTCPAGITMSLADGVDGIYKLTPSGNTYTLESLYPVYSTRGYLLEPVKYNINMAVGITSAEVNAVKTARLLDGSEFSMSSKRTFKIWASGALSGALPYVGYSSASAYLANPGGSAAGSFELTTALRKELPAKLGEVNLGNAGGEATAPKSIRYEFDAAKVRVSRVPLILKKGKTINTVKYKLQGDPNWHVATIPPRTGSDLYTAYVKLSDLGLGDDALLAAFEHELGSLSAGISKSCKLIGNPIADYDCETIATAELFDTANPATTTGKADIQSRIRPERHTMGFQPPPSTAVSAGKRVHIGDFTINRQSGNNAISDYQLFICVPDFSDLDPKSVNIRTSEHNLKAYRIIEGPFVSTSGKRYYRISKKTPTR